jgi:beta-glucosidase/6-phospho-beta-glucosidase/beta-galactosidase
VIGGPDGTGFGWAVGIEDTFVPQVARSTGRVLDEYELTQHYRFWRDDIDRVASLGVGYVRYGIPWYRVNPAPGVFDWAWTDEVIPYLVETACIAPIIDLMHYGCPLWLHREFVNPDYPARVAAYAAAFAERYRDLVRYYTPLNEPLVNSHFCGRAAIWPPHLRGNRGYVRLMVAIAEGMSRTIAALRAVQPDAVIVHVEATESVVGEPELAGEVQLAREQQFLAADLVHGLVGDGHPLLPWLHAHGADAAALERLRASPQRMDVMGVNFYSQFSCTRMLGAPGDVARRRYYGDDRELEGVLRIWDERYGLPIMVTETSERGAVWRRARWLERSLAAVTRARESGVSVVGYTWFPVFSLVAWTYRRGGKPVDEYLFHMGLWDLRADGDGTLHRVETPLVGRYRDLVHSGAPP